MVLIPAAITQIFSPIAERVILAGILDKEAKLCNLKEIISCFIYIFQSKFLTYIFKVIIYFQLNQEFLISQLILL